MRANWFSNAILKYELNVAGYKYAGLQYSNQCWCGNSTAYSKYGQTGCDETCPGNSEQICGGSFYNSVYKISM